MASTLRRSSSAFSLAIVGIFLRLRFLRSAIVLCVSGGWEEGTWKEQRKSGPWYLVNSEGHFSFWLCKLGTCLLLLSGFVLKDSAASILWPTRCPDLQLWQLLGPQKEAIDFSLQVSSPAKAIFNQRLFSTYSMGIWLRMCHCLREAFTMSAFYKQCCSYRAQQFPPLFLSFFLPWFGWNEFFFWIGIGSLFPASNYHTSSYALLIRCGYPLLYVSQRPLLFCSITCWQADTSIHLATWV